jgi:hypothetical protein
MIGCDGLDSLQTCRASAQGGVLPRMIREEVIWSLHLIKLVCPGKDRALSYRVGCVRRSTGFLADASQGASISLKMRRGWTVDGQSTAQQAGLGSRHRSLF